MITIIGVGHVFDIKDRIEEEIRERRPAVVAVELDKARYHSLVSGEEGEPDSLMYRALAHIQKRIGKKYGVKPGTEMLKAVDTAHKMGVGVAFIDLPAQMVFKKLFSQMSLKEKIYFAGGLIAGLFTGKERIEKEMKRYEENEEMYMDVMEKNMPSFSRILIDERNEHMARGLRELEDEFENVLAVVGDGHVRGMMDELHDRELEVVRLKEVRGGDEKRSTSDVEFSYELR